MLYLPGLISDLFGEKVPAMELTKKQRAEMIPKLREIIVRFQNVEQLKLEYKEPAATDEEWRSRLDKMSSEFAPIAEIPNGMHFAEYLRQSYALFMIAPLSVDFFKDTNYARCVEALDQLSGKAFDLGQTLEFDELFNQALGSSDVRPVLQSYLSSFEKRCELLRKKPGHSLEKKDIDQLIEIYRAVSGDFEKAVRLSVGMFEILEGKKADYAKLSSHPFANNIQFLRDRNKVLVQDFNSIIRNSIAHGNSFISISSETVTFTDREKTEIVSFADFLLKCKMLIASTTALTLAPAIFMHRRWDVIWQRYIFGSGNQTSS